jgi:hypothetical protein
MSFCFFNITDHTSSLCISYHGSLSFMNAAIYSYFALSSWIESLGAILAVLKAMLNLLLRAM